VTGIFLKPHLKKVTVVAGPKVPLASAGGVQDVVVKTCFFKFVLTVVSSVAQTTSAEVVSQMLIVLWKVLLDGCGAGGLYLSTQILGSEDWLSQPKS
jgi:hypothetical protein